MKQFKSAFVIASKACCNRAFSLAMVLSNWVLLPIIGNELLNLGIVEISTERDCQRLEETARDWRRLKET